MIFNYNGCANKPGIYEIRNRLSNKSYIGSAKTIKLRWLGHASSFRTGKQRNSHLQRSYDKYNVELGHSDFIEFHILEIMENSTKEERLIKEERWIQFAIANNVVLYNNQLLPTTENKIWSNNPEITREKHRLSYKGESRKGKSHEDIVGKEKADLWSERQSESIKEYYSTEAGKAVIQRSVKRIEGKTYEEVYGIEKTKEIKDNLSLLRKGKSYVEVFGEEKAEQMKKKQSISRAEYLKNHPESLFSIRKTLSTEERKLLSEKMSGENNPFFGKTHTDETKRIISEKQKRVSLEKRCGKESADRIKEKRREDMSKRINNDPEFRKSLGRFIKGKSLEEYYGTERAKEIKEKRSKGIAKTHTGFNLIDIEGNVYTEIINMLAFCKEHGLCVRHLPKLLNGKLKTHCGWKLLPKSTIDIRPEEPHDEKE